MGGREHRHRGREYVVMVVGERYVKTEARVERERERKAV